MTLPTREKLKEQARIMKDFLCSSDYPITLTTCYQCLAKTWGFEGWNEMAAYYKKEDK